MAELEIGVLGELTLARDGVPVDVTGPGRRALLAHLAAEAGRTVTVEQLVAGRWEGDPPSSAVKVVQTHVSQLRRLLEPNRDGEWRWLVTRPSGYQLAVAREAVDAARFEAAVHATDDLPDVAAVDPLRSALALWRGPAFAGLDTPFVRAEADRLEQLRRAARTRCLRGELARGHHREVDGELRALVAEHPLDETLAELLMVALYRLGRAAEALQVHAELRRRLADELGTDPGPSLSRVHAQVLRQDPRLHVERPGPDADVDASPLPRLPRPRTRFVGRQQEVAEVATMVAQHRLTTLVGAGGAGKSRLAVEAATRAADGFHDVRMVALAALDDPTHLAGHCLSELGLLDQLDRPPLDTLRGWLGGRHVLLLLDNCEHLVDAVAELTDRLLHDAPRLHVLATSRLPLRCPGEHRWRVPTMELPETDEPAAVATSEAGALFVQRATDARGDFHLDATTAPAVHRICRRLDGIPLAIELAAVRVATMSADELATGLDDRFQLLTSGDRTALPRHRTLLATTQWSDELLTEAQRRLLRRLSVFVADVEVDTVADVCGWAPLTARDVPGLLADLVDHSLVEAHEAGGRTRYRLLETVREYGRERLGDDADELARRYGDWAARLSEAVGANAPLDTAAWYARFDREFVHLQGALSAAVRRGDAATALRIAAGSGWAPIIVGRFHRLREWLRQALTLADGASLDDRVLAQGLLMAGAVAGIDHRFEGTLDLLTEAHERFGTAGHTDGQVWCGYWRAATLAEMGELAASLTEIEAAATTAADHGLDLVEANARAEQAELLIAAAIDRGGPDHADLAAAGAALERAGTLATEHGMQEISARVGLSDALLTALRGEPEVALRHAEEELTRWRRLGRGNRLILGLVATAKVALLAGRHDVAAPLAVEALRLIGEFAWSGPLRGACQVVVVLSADQDPATAAQLLGAADARPPTHRWRMPIALDEVRATLRARLGAPRTDELLATGAALPLDAVVALALEATRPVAGDPSDARPRVGTGDVGR